MAWDRERPYAPFTVFKKGTVFYDRGERERMESFSYVTPDEKDIETIYDKQAVSCSELLGRQAYVGMEFRPFKGVEMELEYETFGRGRSSITFYWRDKDGTQYPMFATEIDKLIKNGIISNRICGLWSAEKHGQNYGIRLDRLLWRGTSDADGQKPIP